MVHPTTEKGLIKNGFLVGRKTKKKFAERRSFRLGERESERETRVRVLRETRNSNFYDLFFKIKKNGLLAGRKNKKKEFFSSLLFFAFLFFSFFLSFLP